MTGRDAGGAVPLGPANGSGSRRLGRRLALGVVLVSTLVTGVLTMLELYRQYRIEVDEIQRQFVSINRSMVPALAEAAWVGDPVQIQTILEGLASLRDVELATVSVQDGTSWDAGLRVSQHTLTHAVSLTRSYKGRVLTIGKLELLASVDNIYGRLWGMLLVTLASNAIKTALVVLFMVYLFQRLVGRHLQHIASHMIGLDSDSPGALVLDRRPGRGAWRPDILDEVVAAVTQAKKSLAAQRAQLHSQVAALQASEERYRSLVEQAADAVFIAGPDGRLREANSRACDMFGYAQGEFRGQPATMVVAEHETRRQEEAMGRVLAGKRIQEERQFRRRDGTLFPGEIVAGLTGGGLLLAIVRDITPRKRAEEQLQQSEKKFFNAFHVSPSPICITRIADGTFLDVNEAFLSLFELRREETIGQTSTELNILTAAERSHLIDSQIASGGLKNAELLTRSARGKPISLLFSSKPMELAGEACHITIMIDITERKRTEEKLREQSAFLDKVIESSALSTWIADARGTAVRANPACLEFFGAAAEEVIGKYNIFQDNVLREKGFAGTIRKVFEKGVPESILIDYDFTRVAHVDVRLAKHKIINSIFTPILDDAGKVMNVIVQTIDLTEIKRMEAELVQARKMESIGNLAGGIAHDFNNILTVIIGYTELALDGMQKGTMDEESLQEVYAAGNRAKELVKQILAFARQSDEKKRPLQVGSVAAEVLKFIRSAIPSTVEIQQEIHSDALVMGNETTIHQVLMNLCTNAAHAMEDSGGTLAVSLRDRSFDLAAVPKGLDPGEYVEIKVSDTGVGIPPEIMDSIFDPYFTTKAPGEGTGMGLAVAHGVMESYGGKIFVESRPGKGTTFTLYLPATKKRAPTETYVPEQLPSGTEHILFVDDEASIAKSGRLILEGLGYRVTSCTSGTEALALFQADPDRFDLVVTDMTMPNLTGDKLAAAVMKIRPEIPVILCTGYSRKVSDEISRDIGIRTFAYKPMIKADLARTVRRVLDGAGTPLAAS